MLAQLRLLAFALLLAPVAVTLGAAQLLAVKIAPRRRDLVPRLFHRIFLRLLRLRMTVVGEPAGDGTLYVANHVSWADIPLLGAATGGIFVARGDMAGWPLIGPLARAHGIIFVDRERARTAGGQAAAIRAQLARGEDVILFPEGTTSAGDGLLPFKSALFAAVDGLPGARVQPVTIAYVSVGGRAPLADEGDRIAWVGEIGFGAHLAGWLGLPPVAARLTFHPSLDPEAFADRKALADEARAKILAGSADIVDSLTCGPRETPSFYSVLTIAR